MNEPRVIESVNNECQSLGRAHESSSARAEQLIACLEGEIAKRDETIARLEPQLNRAIQANYDLREELAACRVAVENCEVFRARIAELEHRCGMYGLELTNEVERRLQAERQMSALKAQDPVAAVKHGPLDSDGWPEFVLVETIGDFDLENLPSGMKLYAAPVSEAKAQGVVMDGSRLAGLLEQVRLDDDDAKPHGSGATYWNNAVIACQVAIRDALAAPVVSAEQQVVVMPPSPYMPGSQPTDFTDYELGEIHGRIAMWDEVKRLNAAPVVNQQLTTECERCGNSGRIDIGTVCDNWVDCPECAELERHL